MCRGAEQQFKKIKNMQLDIKSKLRTHKIYTHKNMQLDDFLFLLDNQYVRDLYNNIECKVVVGSGMVLPHSGSVAEMAFLVGAEEKLLHQFDLFGIDLYGRFKDDVLVILRDQSMVQPMLDVLSEGHPFIIKCESVSIQSCHFLECMCRKGSRAFEIFPVTKATALDTPWLSRHSAHHSSVHNSWPSSRLRSRLELCSNRKLRRMDIEDFLKRAKLQQITRKASSSLKVFKNRVPLQKVPDNKIRSLWMVLPFYPILKGSGLGARLHSFFGTSWIKRSLLYLMGEPTQVRVAWANPNFAIQHIVKHSGGARGMEEG